MPGELGRPNGPSHRPHVHAALRVSALSAAWTLVSSTLAVVIGFRSDTTVLIAFGGVGFVDAVGSIVLVYHFHHGLRQGRLSGELENVAHRVVLVGLLSVGCAAIAGGLIRLTSAQPSDGSNAGAALAAISLLALSALAARKQDIGRRIASNALVSDGHLSAIGALQAAVTLLGTAVARWPGWPWADAAATIVVGMVAAGLAVSTWRVEARLARRPGALDE